MIIELALASVSVFQTFRGTWICHVFGIPSKFNFQSGACPSITTPEKVTLVPHWIVNNVPK